MGAFDHPFLHNSNAPIGKIMLEAIGVASIDELYSDIPSQVRTSRPLTVDWLPSEQEVKNHIDRMLADNKSASDMPVFLVAGIFYHYLPPSVNAIPARTEVQTPYTLRHAYISHR